MKIRGFKLAKELQWSLQYLRFGYAVNSDFLKRGMACDALLFELCWKLCNLTDFIIDGILLVDCNTAVKLLCGLREAVHAVSCSVQNVASDSNPHPSAGIGLHSEPLVQCWSCWTDISAEGVPVGAVWSFPCVFPMIWSRTQVWRFLPGLWAPGVKWYVASVAKSTSQKGDNAWAGVSFAAEHCFVLWSKQLSKSVRK